MAKQLVLGMCVYCGKEGEVTADHVIPQCLFPGRIPKNAPIVEACKPCNHILKSGLDTYFRDFLIIDIEGSEHPVSKQLFLKLARSMGRNQSKLAQHVTQAKLMPRYTPEGLFAGFVYGTQLPNQSISKGLSMMTRGLYYFYTRQLLPPNIAFEVYRQWDMQKFVPDIQMLLNKGAYYKAAGDGDVFECIYAIVPEQPTVSLWFLSFLRKVYYTVATDRQTAFVKNAS